MPDTLQFIALILLILSVVWLNDHFLLRRYWSRRCTGAEWRRTFPAASKEDIRHFLRLVTDALGFPAKKGFHFSPRDPIMCIYRALYPFPKMMADCMELETFIEGFHRSYGIDLLPLWNDNITLGELFSFTGKPEKPIV